MRALRLKEWESEPGTLPVGSPARSVVVPNEAFTG